MKTNIFTILFCIALTNCLAQVTKSNNTQGVFLNSSGTRTINFDLSDFGANLTIDKVTVLIEFSSQDDGTLGLTFHEDIAFRLESPIGTVTDLVYDARGIFTGNLSQPVTYGGFDPTSTVQVTFDDSAATSVVSSPGGNPITGTFVPIEPLSVFNNESPIGNWTLHLADSFDNGFNDQLFFFFVSISITTPTLDTDEFEEENIKIFPTIVDDIIQINHNNNIISLDIYSISGIQILKLKKNTSRQYNLSQLSSGVYFLKINSEHGHEIKKFIKK